MRTVGAIGGGYALAAAVCVALAKLLPMAPSEATVTATMADVLAMPAAILWMFAASSAARAWAGLLGGVDKFRWSDGSISASTMYAPAHGEF